MRKTSTTTLIDRQHSEALGIPFRDTKPGPEKRLVDWFIHEKQFPMQRGLRATIFREPQLRSGVPDLVAVLWNERAAVRWKDTRQRLTTSDIRLIYFLASEGPKHEQELHVLRITHLEEALDRLVAADMIIRRADRWSARSLHSIFAVKAIIAFEAKISDWKRVLDQALLNTWFASTSYVLVPRAPKDNTFISTASRMGLGVWAKEGGVLGTPQTDESFAPRSYLSWVFNEWVWRAATGCYGRTL